MSRICLIGNSGAKSKSSDGQTAKVRTYLKKMIEEGACVDFIDLEYFHKKPFKILFKIYKGIKTCDRIVLITAERGCKILIPFINFINKKYKKIFVLPLIGIGVLHSIIGKLCDADKLSFFLKGNYSEFKVSKFLIKNLKKITWILPETELLCEIYKGFFGLNNIRLLTNFRDDVKIKATFKNKSSLSLVYLSRVTKEKGIFDLLEVIERIKNNKIDISLDIYGQIMLNYEEKKVFDKYIKNGIAKYNGVACNFEIYDIFSSYDFFVFPTFYFGEGTPGAIIESLIAGTPIITSTFPQVSSILKDGYDSIFFEMRNKKDLEDKLRYLVSNQSLLNKFKENALESGSKYTYSNNKKVFLQYICGVENCH